MNWFHHFIAWPLAVRLTLVSLIGVVLAAIVNWAAYSLAYEATYRSPWSRKHPRDEFFGPSDRVPIFGWWRLRRMAPTLGRGFWIRPLLLEFTAAIIVPVWYAWETVHGGLLSPRPAEDVIAADFRINFVLHCQFFIHLVLSAFMLAASLIDADERNIPDAVTVPGTLFGLTLLTIIPVGMLPYFFDPNTKHIYPLLAAPTFAWPPGWLGPGVTGGLLFSLCCFWFWCWGLVFGGRLPPLRASMLRLRRALSVTIARVRLDPAVPWVVGGAVVGTVLIAMVWQFEAARREALLTSLVGLAGGAAIVWVVRVLGSWAFQKEAMGFGDVTLMAMIGAYLGWQPALIVFFAAPIAALVICLPSWFFGTREMLPYGPYLCSAAAAVVIGWGPIWDWAAPRFEFAWLVPSVLVVGFFLIGCVLALLRGLRSATGG